MIGTARPGLVGGLFGDRRSLRGVHSVYAVMCD
jgi:hypothetical protein